MLVRFHRDARTRKSPLRAFLPLLAASTNFSRLVSKTMQASHSCDWSAEHILSFLTFLRLKSFCQKKYVKMSTSTSRSLADYEDGPRFSKQTNRLPHTKTTFSKSSSTIKNTRYSTCCSLRTMNQNEFLCERTQAQL